MKTVILSVRAMNAVSCGNHLATVFNPVQVFSDPAVDEQYSSNRITRIGGILCN